MGHDLKWHIVRRDPMVPGQVKPNAAAAVTSDVSWRYRETHSIWRMLGAVYGLRGRFRYLICMCMFEVGSRRRLQGRHQGFVDCNTCLQHGMLMLQPRSQTEEIHSRNVTLVLLRSSPQRLGSQPEVIQWEA
jgi:hypothetical protein